MKFKALMNLNNENLVNGMRVSRPAEARLLDRCNWFQSNVRIFLVVVISGFHNLLNVICHSNIRFRRCFEVSQFFFRCKIFNLIIRDHVFQISLAAHQKQRTFHLVKLKSLNPNSKSLKRIFVIKRKTQADRMRIYL